MNNSHLKTASRALPLSLLCLSFGFVLLLADIPAAAAQQSSATASSTEAQVFSGKKIDEKFSSIKAMDKKEGGGGDLLGDYGSHKILLSVRTSSGGAEMHQHFDDVIIMKQGRATLVTGGSIVDAKTGPDGETKGPRIQGGVRRAVTAGDIVHIPAGTPHQLLLQPGNSYSAVVIKVKE